MSAAPLEFPKIDHPQVSVADAFVEGPASSQWIRGGDDDQVAACGESRFVPNDRDNVVGMLSVAAATDTVWEEVRLAGLSDDLDVESLRAAAERSRVYYNRRAQSDDTYALGGRRYRLAELALSNERLIDILTRTPFSEVPARIQAECRGYRPVSGAKFTAYYEAELRGSRVRDERYRYPIYRMPDALTLASVVGSSDAEGRVAIPARREIDGGQVLANKGLELAWTDDPVGLYFLHIQGSGRLRMTDGTVVRVGFGGTNGLTYRSIGRYMLDNNIVPSSQGSADAMRSWLKAHPAERDEILFQNPRYIFFRELNVDPSLGPIGSLGVPLVAGRSLATDPDHVPPGVLAWIQTHGPVADERGTLIGWKPISRFAFSHDEGAAIQGVARADIYWGTGEQAGAEAGYLNLPGSLYILICR